MAKPLDQFPVLRASGTEEMRRAIFAAHGVRDIQFPDSDGQFTGYSNQAKLGKISVSFCCNDAPIEWRFPEGDFLRQQFCLSGHGSAGIGQRHEIIGPGQSCVSPADTDNRLGPMFEQIILRVERSILRGKLKALIGKHAVALLDFSPVVITESPELRHLRGLVWFIIHSLDTNDLGPSHPNFSELEQAVALAFLHCVPSIAHELARPSKSVAPWQVKRAEDYIAAHWAAPLTVEILAGAIDASVRSIFKTFSEHRGYSPMEFLREVRLREARGMLQNPSASTTVTAVGLACGFVNLGHFARYFQAAFGELPSETLARAKGRT